MKVITAKVLTDVNTQSKQYRFNRTLSDEFFTQLDPDGFNLVMVALFAHNGDSADILHHRCRVMAKMKGLTEPVEVLLDIDARTYERLTTIDDVIWKEAVTQ